MAKKNYMKYIPKVGGTVAVAVAMTVALSTQVSAAELDETDLLNNDVQPVDGAESTNLPDADTMEPAEYNKAVEEANGEILEENEETVGENEQTQQENNAAAEENEELTNGELPNPDLNLPDAPETPNTDGMNVEEHNEAIGNYNDEAEGYNKDVDDYNNKVDNYNEQAGQYDQQAKEDYLNSAEYQQYLADRAAWEAQEKAHQDYLANNEDYQNSEAYQKYLAEKADWEIKEKAYQDYLANNEDYQNSEAYQKYLAEKADWEIKEKAYQDSLKAVEDFPNSQEYKDYLKEKADWEAKEKAYQDYLANNEDYQNSQEYQDYLEDKTVYDQLVEENEIFGEVTDYNEQVIQNNNNVDEMNKALESVDVGVVESVDDVGELNKNVKIGEDVLTVLRSFDLLAEEQGNLATEGTKLANHAGKGADLGSDEYAAYLEAVTEYNKKVDAFNVKVAAYNAAVAAYNEAVDTYNQNKPTDSSSSTGIGTATSNKKADWGNIKTQGETVGHIDVKYNAAASKDVTYEDGKPSYSTSVAGYEVTGVYSSEAAAKENPDVYGVSYQESSTNTTVNTQKMNPYGGYEFHAGNVNGIRLDMASGKISFYATLEGEDGTEDITVNLDANSVYADGSYYAVSNGGFLGDYRFGENKDQKLEIETIDGVQYYNISGHSVYVISALTCDGMTKYNSGYGYGRTTVLDPWGLDLVLNMQTMIEIHQSASAQKVGYLSYEMGKTAQADAPDAPGTEPTPPVVQKPGDAPEIEFPTVEPNPGPAPGAPVVQKPGDAPSIDIPGLEPEPGPAPGVPVVQEPGNAPNAPTAPTPVHRLEPVGKLDYLHEKVEIVVPPAPQPDPGPGPGPNPDPQPVVIDDDGPVIIDDGAVPLADVPKTGDATAVFGAMSAFSGFGLAFLQMFGRKKKEEK